MVIKATSLALALDELKSDGTETQVRKRFQITYLQES